VSLFFAAVAVLLFINVLVGLGWGLEGKTFAERLLSVRLLAPLGVAVLLLLAEAGEASTLWDMALLFAVGVALAVTAFTSQLKSSQGPAR
jgi:hypothetical protein